MFLLIPFWMLTNLKLKQNSAKDILFGDEYKKFCTKSFLTVKLSECIWCLVINFQSIEAVEEQHFC